MAVIILFSVKIVSVEASQESRCVRRLGTDGAFELIDLIGYMVGDVDSLTAAAMQTWMALDENKARSCVQLPDQVDEVLSTPQAPPR